MTLGHDLGHWIHKRCADLNYCSPLTPRRTGCDERLRGGPFVLKQTLVLFREMPRIPQPYFAHTSTYNTHRCLAGRYWSRSYKELHRHACARSGRIGRTARSMQ